MNKYTSITLLLFLISAPLNAQVFPQLGGSESSVYDLAEEELGEFNFVRVQYDTYWGGGFGYGTWSIDFPDADMNFLRASLGSPTSRWSAILSYCGLMMSRSLIIHSCICWKSGRMAESS